MRELDHVSHREVRVLAKSKTYTTLLGSCNVKCSHKSMLRTALSKNSASPESISVQVDWLLENGADLRAKTLAGALCSTAFLIFAAAAVPTPGLLS